MSSGSTSDQDGLHRSLQRVLTYTHVSLGLPLLLSTGCTLKKQPPSLIPGTAQPAEELAGG
jgi:hypothetical protein